MDRPGHGGSEGRRSGCEEDENLKPLKTQKQEDERHFLCDDVTSDGQTQLEEAFM